MYNFLSDSKVLTLQVHQNITQRAYENAKLTKKIYIFSADKSKMKSNSFRIASKHKIDNYG